MNVVLLHIFQVLLITTTTSSLGRLQSQLIKISNIIRGPFLSPTSQIMVVVVVVIIVIVLKVCDSQTVIHIIYNVQYSIDKK